MKFLKKVEEYREVGRLPRKEKDVKKFLDSCIIEFKRLKPGRSLAFRFIDEHKAMKFAMAIRWRRSRDEIFGMRISREKKVVILNKTGAEKMKNPISNELEEFIQDNTRKMIEKSKEKRRKTSIDPHYEHTCILCHKKFKTKQRGVNVCGTCKI